MSKTSITIIGAGPAGVATAIQLKRYGLDPMLLEKECAGGLLRNANWVENYPGFPNGVSGAKLVTLMKKQMQHIGVEVKQEEVLNVDLHGNNLVLVTQGATRNTDFLVIATGTKSKPIPDIVSTEVRDKVFTEVWPLLEARGKHIVVIGAGDAAFDYALNLSKKRNSVTILNRGETVKCLQLLWDRAARESAIAYRARVAVSRVDVDETAGRLKVRCEADGSSEAVRADYVIFAIGREPQLDFLSEDVKRRESELVAVGQLYFVGDVKNGLFRQVAIAAGDGLRAAMQIYAKLEK